MSPPPANRVRPFLDQTTVLIPALNEAAVIAATVRHWLQLGTLDVLVVDNGSTDDTATQAASAGARVVREPCRGYGAAAWKGLQHLPPAAVWVLFISADNSDRFQPEELPDWQAAIDRGADLVLGDRCSLTSARSALRPSQRVGSWIFRHAVRIGWGHRFVDMGSRRLIRVDRLAELHLRDRGFGWNVEMQLRALEAGFRIFELPSHFHPRAAGDSKISGNLLGSARAACGILTMLARLWWTRRR